ncbi:hypothetical protein GGR52DRAFT_567869 [Hypoxylon sp. FL1284]|nr:hypothetical protein GGR52DRAFT_567869 [Hypoxylon sp. FL1284]
MSFNGIPTMDLRPFQPSEQLTGQSRQARFNYAMVGNYQGDPTLAANTGTHVPEHLNTNVWITNLPLRIDTHELLQHVAFFKIGRVRATVINPPWGMNQTSAASISFFRREHAEKLIALIRGGLVMIRGMIPCARWNRNKVMQQNVYNKSFVKSRVLLIAGNPEIVNVHALEEFFSRKFIWQTDCVIDHGTVDGVGGPIGRIEYRFGSFRNQASFGYNALRRELAGFALVQYGADPCEV